MKKAILIATALIFTIGANAQTSPKKLTTTQVITNSIAEIACGECRFKMKGKSCDLAVRINGKTYFVDGKNIDDFGDAHGEHGFCNAISKAKVSGKIVNNKFKASAITLISK